MSYRDRKQRAVAAVARKLAERATLLPAYLVDEETFDGWYREAEERVERTPEPTLTRLQEAIERAQHGEMGVGSRLFSDWVNAALASTPPGDQQETKHNG